MYEQAILTNQYYALSIQHGALRLIPDIRKMKLHCAGLLVIEHKKLLLAYSKNKQCFYLPGGKVAAGETAEQALQREIKEELNIELDASDLSYFTHISAAAYGEKENVIMEQDCFLLNKKIEPVASAEIGALAYFTLESYLQQPAKAPGAVMILEKLKAEGIIE